MKIFLFPNDSYTPLNAKLKHKYILKGTYLKDLWLSPKSFKKRVVFIDIIIIIIIIIIIGTTTVCVSWPALLSFLNE
jgi:hypothetical protein